MTTVQIIGVSVAGAAVVLLVIALLVSRRHRDEEEDPVRTGPSFLDQAPQDTLSGLGKAEQPVEDITLDPAVERAAAERAAVVPRTREKQQPPGGLGLDWGPDLSVQERAAEPAAGSPLAGEAPTSEQTAADDTETTGELPPADAQTKTTGGLRAADSEAAGDERERPAAGGRAVAPSEALGQGSTSRLVPLSDIIVTTSEKMVDLEDPEVRRMLTELVTFEVDQAADLRRQGQTIDAVLQLTEAEKVSRALGMAESAMRIRAMIEEIRLDD